MAAVTAAVVVAGAAAATAGMQAAQAAKAGDAAGAGYIPPSASEAAFNKGTRQILESERLILDDALAQGKLIEPELYRALGLEPIYDRPEDPEYAQMSEALAGKQARLGDLQREIADIKALSGPGKKARLNRIEGLARERKNINREIASLTQEVETRGAVGRRVVGFRPLPGIADPTGSTNGSFGAALDGFNANLSRALAGEDPLDPTLKREYDDRERTLRERLRRQMGPDYETSTGGAQALANFDRERAEAFAQYNREQIVTYSSLAESRARSLSDLTGDRLQNLSFPSSLRIAQGQALEGTAEARKNYAAIPAGERAAKGAARAEAKAAEAQARAEQTRAVGNILAGVGSAAGTAGSLSGGQVTAPTTGSTQIPYYLQRP